MLVNSEMLPLGTSAPLFCLPDFNQVGRTIDLSDYKSDLATVVMFICNHCPFVQLLQESLVDTARQCQTKGIVFIAISSNDVDNYPEDGPVEMTRVAQHFGYPFPYCYDASQDIAKAYHAECTPDFFVFDGQLKLIYRGRYDEATPSNGVMPSGQDLRQALDAVVAGQPVSDVQHPSMGCNIKWIDGE